MLNEALLMKRSCRILKLQVTERGSCLQLEARASLSRRVSMRICREVRAGFINWMTMSAADLLVSAPRLPS